VNTISYLDNFQIRTSNFPYMEYRSQVRGNVPRSYYTWLLIVYSVTHGKLHEVLAIYVFMTKY